VLVPELATLKKTYFGGHPDDPVILHRSEIVKRDPPFDVLIDPAIGARFDAELFDRLSSWSYSVFTVTLDKTAFAAAFPTLRPDPYHRCVEYIATRFAAWLAHSDAVGDVLAESRGGNEDQRLKESFRHALDSARTLDPNGALATRLTSREIKVKPKAINVAGLQLADLIAHPAFLAALDLREGRPRRADYGGRLVTMLEEQKYARDREGQIDGTGRLWIP